MNLRITNKKWNIFKSIKIIQSSYSSRIAEYRFPFNEKMIQLIEIDQCFLSFILFYVVLRGPWMEFSTLGCFILSPIVTIPEMCRHESPEELRYWNIIRDGLNPCSADSVCKGNQKIGDYTADPDQTAPEGFVNFFF